MDIKELLGEELYSRVQEKLGDKKLIVNDGNYIPKSKFDEKNEELKATKAKVEQLGSTSQEAETLKASFEALKGEYDQFKADSEKRINDTQKKQAIERNLARANANPDTIDLLVDKFELDKLVLDSKGEIVDWDVHLNPIKEQRKTLFGEVQVTGNKPQSGQNVDKLATLKQQHSSAKNLAEKLMIKREIDQMEQQQ